MPSVQQKRKIAVIIPKYGLTGGAERFVASLTEQLTLNPTYAIHVFANKWISNSEKITFHHIPVIFFPRFLTTLSFAWFVDRALRLGQYDIVHTHDRILYADLFTMHGVPHRFWIHTIRGKRMSFYDKITAWVEKKLVTDPTCKFLLPVSTLAQEQYQQEFPETRDRLRVVHPGIDLMRFTQSHKEVTRSRIRGQFNIEPSAFVILFVGMNFELKGLDPLISAVAEVIRKKPAHAQQIKLLVVGKGNQDRYRKIAENHGIQNTVIFAGVQNEGIEQFYAAADIYALLSGFDTFGMTVLEAMASQLPVIISHTVGAKDLVTEGVNGYVVEKNNITDISDRIIALLNPEQRLKMGQAARRVAKRRSWTNMAMELTEIYESILSTR